MSGGHFNYNQYILKDIIEELEIELKNPSEFIENIKDYKDVCNDAIRHLRVAYTYVHRLDWFLSGDDSEETFYKRLIEDLTEVITSGEHYQTTMSLEDDEDETMATK